MPDSPAKVPPARLVRLVDGARTTLQKLNRRLVPGNIALLELAQGGWVTQALYAAAKLGIADQLSGGPLGADEVARRVGSDPDATFRLMRALASRSVLTQGNDGRFALTALGQALRSDHQNSIRPMILFIGSPEHWEEWANLLHSVQTGEAATTTLRGMPYFDYLATNPAQAAIFNDAMSTMATVANDVVLPAYDFNEFRCIVDVGGGHGRLLTAILQSAPDAAGVLYDLPSVVEGAPQVLQTAGVADRCTVAGGSFLDSVPAGGDAYILKSIVHDWDDGSALHILRNVRTAIESNGTVLLLEVVLPERATSSWGSMLDLEMLVTVGGRERTRAEYADLLARAGFRLTRVVDTATPMMSIVEAVPV